MNSNDEAPRTENLHDVVIVGGGPAGLNAALVLAQAQRKVLVIDAGEPRNAPAAHLHGFLTRDGLPPTELLHLGRAEVKEFGVEFLGGSVVSARRDGDAFVVESADGTQVRTPRLLVTTGLRDELPDIDGLAEQWGRGVAHCPFCHGYEVRGEPIGVVATSEMSVHQALMVRQWSEDVTFFVHTASEPTDEQLEVFEARGIAVVRGRVAGIDTTDDRLTGVRLEDGTVVPRGAVFVATRMVPRDGLLAELGVETQETPAGRFPAVDAMGATSVTGVWAAGNVVDPHAQVILSAAAGYRAASAIVADVLAADIAADLARLRARR
ncbi:NAD(P)/FAD-dependent oxidoreductase [Rhodococcus triatomae]|uniref:Thioredoxin reductase n=1 Tax=Rhodococcus triatomae TaxID=300028 RepID=A0A1G8F103_9NOCA|nr:NAD(P)/FAD-dependent oxidoreductase [Rhodococcus triatomae]QNG19355.1 NAD(P)/FAD-dependent oxidoreductase [Rhodococcus triatomae]QNG24732.1 NAD(P)/FAD-dependent oxidoreductase [Rhodococcus triatomae]SDH75825.1 Thioredoxin reductase [Rhodococcus triatomae]